MSNNKQEVVETKPEVKKPIAKKPTDAKKSVTKIESSDKGETKAKVIITTPKLVIRGEEIPLVETKVNLPQPQIGRIPGYAVRNEYPELKDLTIGTYWHAKVDNIDYYLDKNSSVEVGEKRRTPLDFDDYLDCDFEDVKSYPVNYLVAVDSELNLATKPYGACISVGVKATKLTLINSIISKKPVVKGFGWKVEIDKSVLSDSYVLDTRLNNMTVSDSLLNRVCFEHASNSSGYIKEAKIVNSTLTSKAGMTIKSVHLEKTRLNFNGIEIFFKPTHYWSLPKIENVWIHSTSQHLLRAEHVFELGELFNNHNKAYNNHSGLPVQFFKSIKEGDSVYVVIYRKKGKDQQEIIFNDSMNKEEIFNKLKPVVSNREETTDWRNYDQHLCDLEKSILDQLTSVIHGRLIVDKTLKLADKL